MVRLTDEELLELLDGTESDRVERKESFGGDVPKKSRQAVCAFANDLPGYNQPGVLFIGAEDNGEPSGLEITEQLLLSLADMKTDGNILPLPVLTVEKRGLNGGEIAVVTVMPSDMPPVKYDGRIWIRTGPRRSIANAQEERILNEKRRYKNLPFDNYPIPSATINDLSRVVFENEYLPRAFAEDVLQENKRSYEERLVACRMIHLLEDTVPTVMGLLAVGKYPQRFLPGSYIQFLRIEGTKLDDPVVDEEKIDGGIVEMLRRGEEKLKAHNRTAVDITSGATHMITAPYPQTALQQILYNAVLHRTYEGTNAPVQLFWFNDRIEIRSPGGPYGNVTPENFGEPGAVDYRNPNIADVLKIFGFVQVFGRGIITARSAMEKNGNPPLEFRIDRTSVLCTLRARS